MTDQDLTAARAAIVRVYELLEHFESKGRTTVDLADVRETLRDQAETEPLTGLDVALTAVRESLADAELDGADFAVLRVSDARALIAAADPIARAGKRYDR